MVDQDQILRAVSSTELFVRCAPIQYCIGHAPSSVVCNVNKQCHFVASLHTSTTQVATTNKRVNSSRVCNSWSTVQYSNCFRFLIRIHAREQTDESGADQRVAETREC
jgi:hypothetical protein